MFSLSHKLQTPDVGRSLDRRRRRRPDTQMSSSPLKGLGLGLGQSAVTPIRSNPPDSSPVVD